MQASLSPPSGPERLGFNSELGRRKARETHRTPEVGKGGSEFDPGFDESQVVHIPWQACSVGLKAVALWCEV